MCCLALHRLKFQWPVFEGAKGDLPIVERDRVIGKFLVSLVALARDEDDVARLGEGDGAGDRFGAVGDGFEIARAKSFFHVGDDGERIFFSSDYRK